MSARDELIEIVTRDPQSSGGDPTWATDLVDAHAAEVRAATLAEVTAWLVKKSREGFPDAAVLASKVARGAVRPDNLRMLPPDFFEPGHTYTHRNGSTFRCVAVDAHPESGWRVAIGWHTDTAGWTFIDFRNVDHWNHEYDGVQAPTEGGAS